MGSTDSKGGNVTSAGWQVTLCDPMWHVSSRSGVTTLRTAIHLLLTCYLLSTMLNISVETLEHIFTADGCTLCLWASVKAGYIHRVQFGT